MEEEFDDGERRDRISELPGHLIDQILMHLSFKESAKTSVLSREWRHKWTMVPDLKLADSSVSEIDPDQLADVIDAIIFRLTGPIRKFMYTLNELESPSAMDRWILHLSLYSVEEFILDFFAGVAYNVPSCLFGFQNLRRLELCDCVVSIPHTFKGFVSLKRLRLWDVKLPEAELEHLISSSPMLQELLLSDFKHVEIKAPSLRILEVTNSLEDISLPIPNRLVSVAVGFSGQIMERRAIVGSSSRSLQRFFNDLPQVRRLTFYEYFLEQFSVGEVPETLPNPCLHLKSLLLTINFSNLKEILVALCLLRSCPSLEELELAPGGPDDAMETVPSFWEGHHSPHPLALENIKFLCLRGFSGATAELCFLEYVLLSLPALERLMVRSWNERRYFLLFLWQLKRASRTVRVVYKDMFTTSEHVFPSETQLEWVI